MKNEQNDYARHIIKFKVQNSKFKGKVNEGFSNYCERRYG